MRGDLSWEFGCFVFDFRVPPFDAFAPPRFQCLNVSFSSFECFVIKFYFRFQVSVRRAFLSTLGFLTLSVRVGQVTRIYQRSPLHDFHTVYSSL